MPTLTKSISGWGRYPAHTCELSRPERYADLKADQPSIIARGQGRSYGDASLNEHGHVLLTERINRMLELDIKQGIIKAEAGVTLAEILSVCVKHGWFLPVTPGTRFASLGGCVAADVHGKNHHHDGSFGKHVLGMEMLLADGRRIQCSASENSELFWATVGGMGLTGIIGTVTLKLIPIATSQIQVQHRAAGNLQALFELLNDPDLDDHYSVAWIDCMAKGHKLGRGVAMFGHHASVDEYRAALPLTHHVKSVRNLPFDFPGWLLNPLSINLFNQAYFWNEGRKTDAFLTSYESYFYPLDAIGQWNRMYGKRGFLQYQCVLPETQALSGMTRLLQAISASRNASFLAVLKRLGESSLGMLSFPMPGFTLALDLPLHDQQALFTLLDRLDQITLEHGGRVYLAKDAHLSAENFRLMYPRYADWLKIKQQFDPANVFNSSLARRLHIGEQP